LHNYYLFILHHIEQLKVSHPFKKKAIFFFSAGFNQDSLAWGFITKTSEESSIFIWEKSVNAVVAVPAASQNAESSASLDVDALLARRARRKALRESTTRNIDIEAPLHDVFTPEVSESQQGVSRAVPGSPQANTSTATPRLLSPLPESTAQKNKSKEVLYETGFKLKSAEERIDHLMKEMGELRMFATVSAQFQNEAEE
jgi:hypothetical protein